MSAVASAALRTPPTSNSRSVPAIVAEPLTRHGSIECSPSAVAVVAVGTLDPQRAAGARELPDLAVVEVELGRRQDNVGVGEPGDRHARVVATDHDAPQVRRVVAEDRDRRRWRAHRIHASSCGSSMSTAVASAS